MIFTNRLFCFILRLYLLVKCVYHVTVPCIDPIFNVLLNLLVRMFGVDYVVSIGAVQSVDCGAGMNCLLFVNRTRIRISFRIIHSDPT